MTYQECICQGKMVICHSIISKSGKPHPYVMKYVGRTGVVSRESKNNMLMIKFNMSQHIIKRILIPACVQLIEETELAGASPNLDDKIALLTRRVCPPVFT